MIITNTSLKAMGNWIKNGKLALKWEIPWCFACILRRTKGVGRPFFLVLASLVSALSHFVLAISTSEAIFTRKSQASILFDEYRLVVD